MLRKENAEMKELLARVQKNFRDEMYSIAASIQNRNTVVYASKDDLTAEIQEVKKDIQEVKKDIQVIKNDAQQNKTRFDTFINAMWSQTKPSINRPRDRMAGFDYSAPIYSMVHEAIKSIGMAN